MAKPAVVIVGADKGGVGKTTVARTLLDYFTAHQIPTRAFDTEAPRGTLKRFHPELTDVVDLTLVPDQMKIIDTLHSAEPSALFHILGPTIASLDEIAETAAYLGDAKYFMVKNFINNTQFFEWDEATHSSYFKRIKDAVEISIPKLNEMATEQLELASVPYLTFIANKKHSGEPASYSFVLRGYVRHWLGNVWAEYDRITLTDIVAARAQAVPVQKPQAVPDRKAQARG